MYLAPIEHRSLRTQIAWVFGVLTAATALLLSFGFGEWLARQGELEAGRTLQRAARNASTMLSQGMAERANHARVLSKAEDVWGKGLASPEARALLARIQSLHSQSAWVGVADDKGTVISASRGMLQGQDVSQRPWFQQGREALFVGDVHPAKLLEYLLPPLPNGEPLRFIDFSAPIVVAGKRIGVLGMHGSWLWADDVIESLLPPNAERDGLEVMVFDRAGELIYASDQRLKELQAAGQTLAALAEARKKPAKIEWKGGIRYLTAMASLPTHIDIPDLGWSVVARQPLKMAYAQSTAIVRKAVAAGLAMALLLAMLSWLFARRLSEDLHALARAAAQVRLRGTSQPIPLLKSSREVLQLSTALSDMTRHLLQAQEGLEAQVLERTRELEQANTELDRQARTDTLTGLLNRRGLNAQFELLLALAGRSLRPLSVITFDIDHFKRINDKHGHAVGDAVLQRVALRLRSALRASDVLARVGGEEFVALLPETDAIGAMALANKIIAELYASPDPDVGTMSVSAGVTTLRGPLDGRADLMRRSDLALYAAKQAGRNRVCLEE